jgi:hypothetical protein
MPRFEVIVGNVGTVYDGRYSHMAYQAFEEYRELSRRGEGRPAGEPVVLMADGEIRLEWDPPSGQTR